MFQLTHISLLALNIIALLLISLVIGLGTAVLHLALLQTNVEINSSVSTIFQCSILFRQFNDIQFKVSVKHYKGIVIEWIGFV